MFIKGSPTEEEKERGDTSNSLFSNYQRIFKRFGSSVETMKDSAFEKLLPDQPMAQGDHKPMTLVIDLDGFLVAHIWDPIQGRWRIAKRPGADLFLYTAAHLYEVVVFSSMNQFEGEQILEKLDPMQFISWRLFRFATNYKDGVYYKPLEKLNRDLGQVGSLDMIKSLINIQIIMLILTNGPEILMMTDCIKQLSLWKLWLIPDRKTVVRLFVYQTPLFLLLMSLI